MVSVPGVASATCGVCEVFAGSVAGLVGMSLRFTLALENLEK